MKRTIAVILLAVCLSLAAGGRAFAGDHIHSDEALSKFVAGNLAYKQGQYAQAIREYEGVIAGGLESGALYYNLGNSYAKMGKTGKAILNYARARRLLPRDGDVQFNYRYMLADAGLRDAVAQENWMKKLVTMHIAFYTLNEMAVIIFILIVVLALFHLMALYLKWPDRLRRGGIGLLLIFLLVYVGGFILKVQVQKDRAVAVDNAEARFEPRAEATVYFPLKEGSQVKIIKREGAWAKVDRPDGKTGWVPAQTLEDI